jgi:hypothetical protein
MGGKPEREREREREGGREGRMTATRGEGGRIQLLAAESFFLRALATECKSNERGN